jgi:hypothetical protein
MMFPKILKLQTESNSKLFLLRLDQWMHKWNQFSKTSHKITIHDKFFMSLVYEFYEYRNVDSVVIPNLKNILPQTDMSLIVDDCCNYTFNNISAVHRIPYFLVNTYIRTYHDLHPINSNWNHSAKKALFLIGKAEKTNRIGLLSKFYDRDALEKIEWSLYTNNGISNRCRNILSYYTDKEFDNFLKTCVKDLDPIKKQLQIESSHYNGFPYDTALYENTLLSIISETIYDQENNTADPILISNNAQITEKTWRTIANRHPFVMASTPGTLKKLKAMGFKTFENYMKITDYDSIVNDQARLTAIADNTEFFIDNYHNHIDDIKADIEHNAYKFEEIAKSEIVKLQEFMQLDNCNTLDTINIIKKFYFLED